MSVAGIVLASVGLKATDWFGDLLDVACDRLFDGAGKRVLAEVQARLPAYTGSIPANHELEHAIRLAELTTTLFLLETYRQQDEGDRFDFRTASPHPFVRAAQRWLRRQIGLSPRLKTTANDALVAELERALDTIISGRDYETIQTALAEAEQRVWNELIAATARAGVADPPAEFDALFRGDKKKKEPGWSLTFVAFMREALKNNARAEVAFLTSRVAAVRGTLERLERKVDTFKSEQVRQTEKLDTILTLISAEKSVPLVTLQEILRGLGDIDAPLDAAKIEQRLRIKADEYHELSGRLSRLTNNDPVVQRYRQEAAAMLAGGGFGEADELLAAAEQIDLESVEELETLAAYRRLSAAESRAERGAAARVRLAYRSAASHYEAAASIVSVYEPAVWLKYRLEQASALYKQGEEFGDKSALIDAINLCRSTLTLVPRDYATGWSATQNLLGNTLQALGARERDCALGRSSLRLPRGFERATAQTSARRVGNHTEQPRSRTPRAWDA